MSEQVEDTENLEYIGSPPGAYKSKSMYRRSTFNFSCSRQTTGASPFCSWYLFIFMFFVDECDAYNCL